MQSKQRKVTKFSEDNGNFQPSFNMNVSSQKTSYRDRNDSSAKRSYTWRNEEGNDQKFGKRNDGQRFSRGGTERFNRREDKYGYTEEEGPSEEARKEQGSFPKKKAGAKEYHKDAKLKNFRLIVRNLPFKTSKEELQNVCCNFGPFSEIVLPASKKMEGKCAGYCFIQFKSRESAETAKEHFNNNKFQGRSIAADWALDKDTYETSAHEEKQNLQNKVKVEKDDSKPAADDESDDSVSEESADEEEESNDSGEEENKGKDKKKKTDNAVEENRVVFLRNLSFDTNAEKLKSEITKFGNVSLALICKFKDSGHSKGTGFVHFSTSEEAASCVEAANSGDLVIDDRTISAVLAVPKEKAAEIENSKLAKAPSDKRNLRLLRFALIREGTSAANGMSAEDGAKRVRLAEATRKKLENLHMFVSPVRLVVQNLPPSLTDAKLRSICREAGGSDSVVTECRIWKDMQRLNAKGEPKSKGFAFVAFSEHKHALECLKKLNNNPSTFTNEKRPIVEFSIEDLTALQTKERRAAAATGEKVNAKQLNEKVRRQVQESIGQVHSSGMKFLPKFLGKKMRHRNMSNAKKKKMGILKGKPKTKGTKPSGGDSRKKSKDSKKTVTKFLAHS